MTNDHCRQQPAIVFKTAAELRQALESVAQ
jgi:hypothetical protein